MSGLFRQHVPEAGVARSTVGLLPEQPTYKEDWDGGKQLE